MGVPLHYQGIPLDMTKAPTADALRALVAHASPMSFDELRARPRGALANAPDPVLDCRLAVRRLRKTFNSVGRNLPETRKRQPFNRAYIHPDELAERGILSGERVRIRSDNGDPVAVASADVTVRRRVVSIAHGFGSLPDTDYGEGNDDYVLNGVSTNCCSKNAREMINAAPQMTGVPVSLSRAN